MAAEQCLWQGTEEDPTPAKEIEDITFITNTVFHCFLQSGFWPVVLLVREKCGGFDINDLMIIVWEMFLWITIGNCLHIMKKNEGKIVYETIHFVKMYFLNGGNVHIGKFSYFCFRFPFI